MTYEKFFNDVKTILCTDCNENRKCNKRYFDLIGCIEEEHSVYMQNKD